MKYEMEQDTLEKLCDDALRKELYPVWHRECPVADLIVCYELDHKPLMVETEQWLFVQHIHCPLCRSASCAALAEDMGEDFQPLESDLPGHPDFEAAMQYIREHEVPKVTKMLTSLRPT